MEDIAWIKKQILNVKSAEACYYFLSSKLSIEENAHILKECEQTIIRVWCWMHILNERERYVLQRHLIEGNDWATVTKEYEHHFGLDFSKTERTLKKYQKSALQKILRFMH